MLSRQITLVHSKANGAANGSLSVLIWTLLLLH